jgi:hypothetical protein
MKTGKLEFSEFEIKDENGKTRITVSENGIIKINGEDIGKINRDGALNDKEGKLLAKITEDTILQDKDGKNLIKIDKSGTMDNGSGAFIKWSESGELLKANEKTGMNISPVDKESFQSASIILFLYLMTIK